MRSPTPGRQHHRDGDELVPCDDDSGFEAFRQACDNFGPGFRCIARDGNLTCARPEVAPGCEGGRGKCVGHTARVCQGSAGFDVDCGDLPRPPDRIPSRADMR